MLDFCMIVILVTTNPLNRYKTTVLSSLGIFLNTMHKQVMIFVFWSIGKILKVQKTALHLDLARTTEANYVVFSSSKSGKTPIRLGRKGLTLCKATRGAIQYLKWFIDPLENTPSCLDIFYHMRRHHGFECFMKLHFRQTTTNHKSSCHAIRRYTR